MSSIYRQNSMMAMLDAKPEEKNGEYWKESNDNLSPVRKHLINTYLQVQDEEVMPLLGEYFSVALSFMALGALVRSSNSVKRKHKRISDEERLDLRSCSRFQRMALESMLKEAMERLRNLSQNAYQLEERVRDLVNENVALDKEKVQLLNNLAEAEKAVQELRALRKAEGRANERVMCIVASKEQDWLKEKKNLQKEIERLKENVNGLTREAKYQARRCRNPNCDHCKGLERVVRNVKGRISLRELNQRDSQGFAKRELSKPDRHLESEEDRELVKAFEHRKRQIEQPGYLKSQNEVDRLPDWRDPSSSSKSSIGAGTSTTKEMLAKQHQDMESELANILKRVGMLKQRSNSGSITSTRKECELREDSRLPVEDTDVAKMFKNNNVVPVQQTGEMGVAQESIVPASAVHDSALEVGDYLSDQEDYFSVGDEDDSSDLVELEKAFESKDGGEASTSLQDGCLLEKAFDSKDGGGTSTSMLEDCPLVKDFDSKDGTEASTSMQEDCTFEKAFNSKDDGETSLLLQDCSPLDPEAFNVDILEEEEKLADPEITNFTEQQLLLDEDAEFAAFERSFNLEENLGVAELGSCGKLLERNRSELDNTASCDQQEPGVLVDSVEDLAVVETQAELGSCGELLERNQSKLDSTASCDQQEPELLVDSVEDLEVVEMEAELIANSEAVEVPSTDEEFLVTEKVGTAGPLEKLDDDEQLEPEAAMEEENDDQEERDTEATMELPSSDDTVCDLGVQIPEDDLNVVALPSEEDTEQTSGYEDAEAEPEEACSGDLDEQSDDIVQSSDSEVHESSEICAVEPVHEGHEAAGGTEHEQVLEVIEETDLTHDISPVIVSAVDIEAEEVDSRSLDVDVSEEDIDHHIDHECESGLDIQENLNFKDICLGQLSENQDIPVFERNGLEDLAGELPEPEEKRVCVSEVFDLSLTASSIDERSQEVENLKKDNGRVLVDDEVVQSEDLPEEIVIATDEKSSNKLCETRQVEELGVDSPVTE